MEEATQKDTGAAAGIEQAALYLEALTGDRDTPVTWCLLHDKKGKGKPCTHRPQSDPLTKVSPS